MKKVKIVVDGMHCMGCVRRIENVLKPIKGLKNVSVSLEDKCISASIKDDLATKQVQTALQDCGFEIKSIDIEE